MGKEKLTAGQDDQQPSARAVCELPETDVGLRELRTEVIGGEILHVNRPIEKYAFDEVAFVGDSVMSMTAFKGKTIDPELPPYSSSHGDTLDFAHGGRMLAPSTLEKNDEAYARDVGGNIEDKVFEAINDPERRYRTIVLNGGFNDIFNRAYHKENPDNVADEVISSYTRIISAAHMAGIQIVLFTIIHKGNLHDTDPRNRANQEPARQAAGYVGRWHDARGIIEAVVEPA